MVTTIGGKDAVTGDFLKKVPGTNVIMTIDGAIYAMVEQHSMKETYKDELEAVGGTNQQVAGVGAFKGTFDAQVLYSTDLPTNWSAITSGDLAVRTVTVVLTDTQGTPVSKTLTLSLCRIYSHGADHRKDQLYRRTISIVYLTPGVWT